MTGSTQESSTATDAKQVIRKDAETTTPSRKNSIQKGTKDDCCSKISVCSSLASRLALAEKLK